MGARDMMSAGYDGARKHAVAVIISSLVGVFTGTVVPLIQQHWSDQATASLIEAADKRAADALAASEARQAAVNSQQHADSMADRQALWQAIAAIQSHTYYPSVSSAAREPNAPESLRRAAAAIESHR